MLSWQNIHQKLSVLLQSANPLNSKIGENISPRVETCNNNSLFQDPNIQNWPAFAVWWKMRAENKWAYLFASPNSSFVVIDRKMIQTDPIVHTVPKESHQPFVRLKLCLKSCKRRKSSKSSAKKKRKSNQEDELHLFGVKERLGKVIPTWFWLFSLFEKWNKNLNLSKEE